MRPLNLTLLSGLAALAVAASASGQTSSSTPVIGYYKFTVPQGNSLWTCAFVTKKDFQGTATSVTGGAQSTITQTGATWSVDGFNTSGAPGKSSHYVEVLDGPNAGMVFDIVSNQNSSLVVDGNAGSSAFKYCVRKHATLGSIFATAGLSPFEDKITLFYDTGAKKDFYFDDTDNGILESDFTTVATNEVVYPGQGFLLNVVTSKQLTFGGGELSYVKDSPTRIPLYGNRLNIVGMMNPIVASAPLTAAAGNEVTVLGATGLLGSSLAEYEDEVQKFGLTGGGVFTKLATYYFDAGQGDIVDINGTPFGGTVSVPNGAAFVVRPVADRVYVQPASYTPEN